MTDKAQAEIERASQARVLLDHPLWVESWDHYEKNLLDAWTSTGAGDTEARERLFLALHAARLARQWVEGVFMTGKMAIMQRESEDGRKR